MVMEISGALKYKILHLHYTKFAFNSQHYLAALTDETGLITRVADPVIPGRRKWPYPMA